MIYDKIAKALNDYLGGDFDIRYANNHDCEWDKILPNSQSQMKFGVLRVDSGITTQVADTNIHTEQLRLNIAIPEDREVFNGAVINLQAMRDGLNQTSVSDSETSTVAILYFGEYQDANSDIINGEKWWIASVTFTATLFADITSSNDVEITINGIDLKGVISVDYLNDRTMDGVVFGYNPSEFVGGNGVKEQRNFVNGIRKQFMITCVYLKNDPLWHDAEHNTGILDNEEDETAVYTIVYNNGIKTRTLSNFIVGVLSEQVVVGDVVKATITFVRG